MIYGEESGKVTYPSNQVFKDINLIVIRYEYLHYSCFLIN